MSYNPELLCTAANLDECIQLLDAGANAILVGEAKFGSRLAGQFDLDMIKEAVTIAHARNGKLYVSMNNLIDNATVELLPAYLTALAEYEVDAIVYGDPAVLVAAKEYAPNVSLHWNAEMTSTNYATAEYWARRGTSRYVLARELNMEQVVDTKEKSVLPIQVQVHGMTAMYHSKRSLIQSYTDYHGEQERHANIQKAAGLYLMENDRPDERYPIFEDEYGTHIMSSDDICMIENLHELLDCKVDSLKIEGILKSTEYNVEIVKAYRKAIDEYLVDPEHYEFDEQLMDSIREIQDPTRELSYGFFFKEQVY
ncbi:peptidase U32 family protein [Paenibacillus endoradicis]|uniref:peptidase U32 family protein n=1 Tax=Paenibacillus endoradicis TaxID=2972487 RepID=UPI0021596EAF|nr:peptidase U32 family protein [Paenibacillus endoradicis]MCR8655774.1 U32 family peptidase [Paenibacillus endoradicis]MCR8658100.1 U32 family peptidase [Paenibacillus endoradicis]